MYINFACKHSTKKVITLHIWLHENKKIRIHAHSNCTHPRQIKKK